MERDDISVVQSNESLGTDKGVQHGIFEDRLVHCLGFFGDPQVTLWLIDQCFDFEVDALTGEHIASVLRNALNFRELLEQSEEKASTTAKSPSSIRDYLGAVKSTGDKALHLVASYSTKEEFAAVMTALTKALRDSEQLDDLDTKNEWRSLFRLQNENGETILHRAAAMSNLGVVSYICEHAPDVACQLDSMNRSTLWHAACGGDDGIISVLGTALESLEWAPTVDYPDDNGLTPLHVACREGHGECVKALLDLGASPRCAAQSSGLTPIHYASLFGNSDCLSAMAEHPDARSSFVQVVKMAGDVGLVPPLHLAAANGWLECVRLLIRHGSPLHPLASAMCIMPESLSDSLIEISSSHSKGDTEVRVQDIPLSTPKQVAAKRGWDVVVEFLELQESFQGHHDLARRVMPVITPTLSDTGLVRTRGTLDLLEMLHNSIRRDQLK